MSASSLEGGGAEDGLHGKHGVMFSCALPAVSKMPSMLFLPASHLSRRTITGVLALWLCVVAAGVWAPLARAHMAAQGGERLCSGEVVPQWAPNPVAHAEHGDAGALHHLIDCPLCLPVLAPPPGVHSSPQHAAPQLVPPEPVATAHMAMPGQWPPARGPPV
jgi:hypothetical protein